VCCSVLQCVATSGDGCSNKCSVERGMLLQCVAVCCSVLQCVAVCCNVLQPPGMGVVTSVPSKEVCCCSVLQCVAMCCSVWQCVAVC